MGTSLPAMSATHRRFPQMSGLAVHSGASQESSSETREAIQEPEWVTRAAELGYDWVRIAWVRAASTPDSWFDAAKADRVVSLWPRVFCLTSGRFAGKPFRLAFWEECIVRLLVGWKVPTEISDETGQSTIIHIRLFRELRLWIPRKSGKSEFLASLALLFWAWEGEVRAQGFCFAMNEEQARIVFDKMSDMIDMQPNLSRHIATYKRAFWCQERKLAFSLLSGKARGKHGRAPAVTVGDEMHEWHSRELADTLRQGEGGSTQPIRLYASTAGLKREGSVGLDLFEESQKMLDGRIHDPTTLVAMFAASDDADWHDERVWASVNPSLGMSPTLAFLRAEYAKAVGSPRGEAQFRCYHLNQFVEQYAVWIPPKKWDACSRKPNGWKSLWNELKGRECFIAFDSTKSFDPAAMCLRFDPLKSGDPVILLWKFWMPEATINQRAKDENVPFDAWARDGVIEEIPGEVFVLSWAIKAAAEACKQFKVKRIGYDPWQANEFYNRLVMPAPGVDDHNPLPEDLFREMRFGTRSLGAASRKFEDRVLAGEYEVAGNPMARWMAKHCLVRFDENMNFVPAKKRSERSIDGIVAAVMCEALALNPGDAGVHVPQGYRISV